MVVENMIPLASNWAEKLPDRLRGFLTGGFALHSSRFALKKRRDERGRIPKSWAAPRKENMLKRIVALSLGVLALQLVNPCHAAIATWTFSDGGATDPYDADAGSRGGSFLSMITGGSAIEAGTLGITGDTPQFYITLPGTNLFGFVLKYDAKMDSDGASQSWAYAYTEEPTFVNLPFGLQPGALTTGWTSYTVDFTGIAGLDDKDDVYFRLTVSSTGIGLNFDNIQVVPEPANVALALFGLCGVGGLIARRAYAWVKA